ncbi:MAG: hypothetical protein R3Y07_00950 [Eubacteriales bacterium]
MGKIFNLKPKTPEFEVKTAPDGKKCISICIFCKDPNHEDIQADYMVLNISEKTKRKNGIDADTSIVLNDTKPCNCCKDRIGDGIAIVEVSDSPIYGDNHKPILQPRNGRPGAYITGKHMVAPDVQTARELFAHARIRDDQQMLLVPEGTVDPVLEQIKKNAEKYLRQQKKDKN